MNKSQDDANGDTEMNSYTSPRGNRMFALLCFLLLAVPGFTQEREPPTVGLALAGGGALGFAHLGVILELDALGVPIHYVAGTSMGSIIGALYATGYDGEEILEIVAGTNWNELFRDTPPRRGLPYQERRAGKRYLAEVGLREGELALRSGVSAGQNVVELLDRLMRRYAVSGSFDRFPRPLRVVATDLVTGEEIVFAEGDLKSAIRASMAVPGVFTPVQYREQLLIDGGWSNVLPVDAVRKMGADEVIAVKLGGVTSEPEQLDSMRKILNQAAAILRQPGQEANLADADLVVEPDVSLFSVVSFDDALALVEAGRRAAREVQAELVALADRATAGAEESPQPLENPLLPPSRDRLLTISRIGYSHARPTPETRRLLEQELLGESWVSEVQEQVEALYDSGGYVYASYQLEPEEDEVALILQLQVAEETRTTVRGGYTFRSEPLTTIDPAFVLRSNLTVRGVTGVGSRWSTDLLLSEVPSIRTEYDHPLTGPLFLVSTLYARGEPFRYYRERKVESSYTRRYYGGSLGVRTVLFEAVQLTAEGVGEWVSTSLQGGVDRELESGAGQLGLSVTAVADNFDRYPFPRRGTESVIDYRYRVQPATGIAHNSLEAEQRYFFPILRASAAGVGYRLFSDLDSGAPPYERSFLGGFGSFSGLHDQELTGRHSATLSGELRFNLFSLPLGAGDRVYLSLRGNVGNVWEEELSTIWREPELISGGSVGLAADTVFGQLHLHFSVAAGEALGENQVRYSTYLLLGNKVDGTLSAAYR
ncbi:MAG: patatin-like phospholipase family protein [Alkalispirochaetaceae bacterium]